MQVIEHSAQQTEESIASLEAGMKEVSDFAKTIAGITKQASDAIAGILQKIFSLLKEVRTSNQENMNNITERIEKFHTVGKEAESLGKLQGESSEKARVVATTSEDTVVQGQQVLNMVKQMQSLLENTLNQANQIVQESATQREAASEVEVSFHQVNDVSKDLMSIG